MKNKTTGKIERLNLKKKELEIKELELRIDKLLLETSPRLFVPNIQDQSQKQPKGETIRNYNPEKRWDKYKKSKIEVREFDLVPKVQPEKQEEWREIDKYIRYEIGGKRYVSINGEEYVRTKDISKLLSERQQKGWMEGFDEGTSLEKELSKLLKDEENERHN